MWQRSDRRFYARHAALEPYAPAILAACFDGAAQVVGQPAYYYRWEEWGQTVCLNVSTWRWHTTDGTTDGHGLYELWAWRWGLDIPHAATELWIIVNDTADRLAAAPRRRRAA